jgi:hypothetical protein
MPKINLRLFGLRMCLDRSREKSTHG